MSSTSSFERMRSIGIMALFAVAVIAVILSVYRSRVRGKPGRSNAGPSRSSAVASPGAVDRESPTGSSRFESNLRDPNLAAPGSDGRARTAPPLLDEAATQTLKGEVKIENETRTEGPMATDQELALDIKDFLIQGGGKPTIRFTRTLDAIEAEVKLVAPVMTSQQFVARLALLDESGGVLEEANALFASAVSAGSTPLVHGYRIEEDGSLATFRAEPKTLRFTFESEEALARASRFRLRAGVIWEPRVEAFTYVEAYTYDPTNGLVNGGWLVKQ